MDFILYNIGLIILGLGFILIVIYLTMIITKKLVKCTVNKCDNKCDNNFDKNINLNQIYDDRPSITYKKMFENPEVGFGYQDFEVNANSATNSFYSKS
jgi:hypothetical protein